MKQKIKPLALSLCLLGMVSIPSFAEEVTNQKVTATSSSTQEKTVPTVKKTIKKKHKTVSHQSSISKSVAPADVSASEASRAPDGYVAPPNTVAAQMQYFPIDIDVPGQSFVSTGPYIGVPWVYSGGDLVINSPTINEDVALLNIRKHIREKLDALGRGETEDHAHLLLSGIVEGEAMYRHPGNGSTSSDIDLTSAGLDAYILGPNTWTSGLISFAYDNSIGSSTNSFNSNARAESSRVFISKAFIVIGNFSKSPIYGTVGQMYVPFGTYSSSMVSSPLTKALGRVKARALLVGYQQQAQQALYGSAFIFKGDSYVGSTSRINNGGINVGYRYVVNGIRGDIGGGLLANIADSQGLQNNGNSTSGPFFAGFGATNNFGNEQIAHRVPAADLRAILSIGDHIDVLAEYISALNSFSKNDLLMNTHGAKPRALNTEVAYTFTVYAKPTSAALGYGLTTDALALGLPAKRYLLVFNTSVWKDTLQSLEFRHDINYSAGSTATGTGSSVTQVITGSGRSDNAVTAQFDLYF